PTTRSTHPAYLLSLPDALPIFLDGQGLAAYAGSGQAVGDAHGVVPVEELRLDHPGAQQLFQHGLGDRDLFRIAGCDLPGALAQEDRKSTRLNSSHVSISYAVFC